MARQAEESCRGCSGYSLGLRLVSYLQTLLSELRALNERSAESRRNREIRRAVETASKGKKIGTPGVWPNKPPRMLNRQQAKKNTISVRDMDRLDEPELPEGNRENRIKRQKWQARPKKSLRTGGAIRKGEVGHKEPHYDTLPPAPGIIARADRQKKAGIASPLLQRLLDRRKVLKQKQSQNPFNPTKEEYQMAEHAILNEETGELEVSDEVGALLDSMVEVLESAGYEIEDGMEAEEFVEQVGEVIETDADLDEAKKEALLKSYNTVVGIVEAAYEDESSDEESEEEAAEPAEGAEESAECEGEDCEDCDSASSDGSSGDDSASADDSSSADSKGRGKKALPFFLKKSKKDESAEEVSDGTAEETEEAAEGEAQEESSITQHTMKHAAQKGYSPGWSAHKAGKPGVPAKNKHGAYTIKSVRPNSRPKRAKLGQKRIPSY